MPSRTTLLAACAALLSACSSGGGPEETRTYDLSDFDSVHAMAGVNVQLRQGPFAVTARGSSDSLDTLKVERDGSDLRISRKTSFVIGWTSDAHVVVTAPGFTSIKASAGADIEGDSLTLEAVEVEANAGADIDLSGTCTALDADSNAGSDIDAGELVCATVTVTANAGGDAIVHATTGVDAKASTGSDVTVHGAPANVSQSASTGGDVKIL